jgi:hypothetical protein
MHTFTLTPTNIYMHTHVHTYTHIYIHTGEWKHITWVLQPVDGTSKAWWTIFLDGVPTNKVLGLYPDNRELGSGRIGKDTW